MVSLLSSEYLIKVYKELLFVFIWNVSMILYTFEEKWICLLHLLTLIK